MGTTERSEIGFGGAPPKIDLEVVWREVGGSLAGEEGRRLFGKIGAVFGAADCGGDIHDVAITSAIVFVFDGMNHIRVPEDGVARLHERDGREGFK